MGIVGSDKKKKDGFTVSNGFLASDGKAKRKEAFDENKAKLQDLPDYEKNVLGSFAKICEHNGRIMKARLKKGIWCVQPTHHSPREARVWGDGVESQALTGRKLPGLILAGVY